MSGKLKGLGFIDLDNFIIGLEKDKQRIQAKAMQGREEVFRRSPTAEVYVFGNFAEQPEWVGDYLYALGFRLIHTPSVNGKGSNLDDQEMSDYIVDAAQDSSVETVFVFSADKHFLPAVNRCRKQRKAVVLFSTRPPNWALKQAASKFIPLYEIRPESTTSVSGEYNQVEVDTLCEKIITFLEESDVPVERTDLLRNLIANGFSGVEVKRGLDEAIEVELVEEIKVENGGRLNVLLQMAS